jgi:hypothetical protein
MATYFTCTKEEGPVAAAWDYLVRIGVDEATIRQGALENLGSGPGPRTEAMPTRSWMYGAMPKLWAAARARWRPEHLEEDLALTRTDQVARRWDAAKLRALAALALRLDPPAVEFAWRVARIPFPEAGRVAELLLAHDPPRFIDWTCALARDPVAAFAAVGNDRPEARDCHVEHVRIDALLALAHVDRARHLPLFESLIPDLSQGVPYQWADSAVIALELAYDPARHRPQMEALLGNWRLNEMQWKEVLDWLKRSPEDQARPLLEYACWHGTDPFARDALGALFDRSGDGAIDFAATLLTHRSKHKRQFAAWRLARCGEPARAAVTPLLQARQKSVREAAQGVLAHLDAQAARQRP